MKNKKMRKTGQVSFFVLLGVLLLIIVGFIIYLVAFSTKERTEREVVTTQQMPTELQEINNYVVGCLDKVSQDGLELIGKRGGMITTNEDGTFNPIKKGRDFVLVDGKMVNYAIINVVVAPWVDIQGVNVLPRIDDGTGNIYENLKHYITGALTKDDFGREGCLKGFNDLFEGKGFSIDSDESTIKIELDITDDDVKVSLNYPLTITNKATGEERELEDFYVTEKIRLKKLHEFLDQMITKEINEKGFNLRAGVGLVGFDDSFKINGVTKNAYEYDDVIEVVDKSSLLKGKPYLFRFARKNRKPIADFSSDPDSSNPFKINFDPSSLSQDPDEDSIDGWSWDFDKDEGGIGEDSGVEKPSHTYVITGTYDVNLKVKDEHGVWSDYREKEISIP